MAGSRFRKSLRGDLFGGNTVAAVALPLAVATSTRLFADASFTYAA
ncbi:hypothetical protein [Mycobacteroides chelonae]|jgi:MFS superfamily sulfate permease-like transporter|nr:hypothetical protein [Mycobacteroides chelonae]